MANQWFRLYHEFATDPKVQMMSEVNQRRLIMLMCIRCCNVSETFHDEEVAFQLRVSLDEWTATKTVFLEKNFIGEGNKLLNWDKRQYRSDTSTERVRKYRDRLKQEGNVSVTPPDTDTDTDKELSSSGDEVDGVDFLTTKKKRKLNGKRWESFKRFWDAFDYKKGKREAADSWYDIPSLTNTLVEQIIKAATAEASRRPKLVSDGGSPKMAQGWISGFRWEDETECQAQKACTPKPFQPKYGDE